MARDLVRFYGYRHPLSNFHKSPFRIGSFIYPTNEHWYQSQKSADFYEQMEIIMADTPKDAKHMSRFIQYPREDWDEKKLLYMFKGLRAKFGQNEELRRYLLSTEDAYLVEDSPHDNFWGRGKNWQGRNMLGKMLMKLREYYASKEDSEVSNT